MFLGNTLRYVFHRPFRARLVIEQMEHIGVRSVPVITLSSLAIGMIFSLQIVDLLGMFNAEVIAGSSVAWMLSRELAPVITTLMLIGKNGSAMAAEIGSMRVTEQTDAMGTMSANPIHDSGGASGNCLRGHVSGIDRTGERRGVAGAYAVALWGLDVDSAVYLSTMFRDVDPRDVLSGIVKAGVMAFMVAVICTYYG